MSPLAERRLAALLSYIESGGSMHGLLRGPVDLDAHAALLDKSDTPEAQAWRTGAFTRLARHMVETVEAPASSPRAIRAKHREWDGWAAQRKVINFAARAAKIRRRRESEGTR